MIGKYIGTSIVALSLLISASPVFAQSTDIAAQIAALLAQIKMLQAQIIQLQAQQNGVSCNTFVDLSYGNFDTDPGGRVSQLQTWLGISSNTFGFGTYGPKTRALWNSKCAGTQTMSSTAISTQSKIFSATLTSGNAPLTVTFRINPIDANYSLDFGDGTNTTFAMMDGVCAYEGCVVLRTHIYERSGTYTASLTQIIPTERKIVGYATITVAGTITASSGTCNIDYTEGTNTRNSFQSTSAECKSFGGQQSQQTSIPSIKVISPAGGEVMKQQSDTPTIKWQSQNAPLGGTISFSLIDASTGKELGYINVGGSNAISGSGTWLYPLNYCHGDTCVPLFGTAQYRIRANLLPSNYCQPSIFAPKCASDSTNQPAVSGDSGVFTVIGQ